MEGDGEALWKRVKKHFLWDRVLGFGLDTSRVPFPEDFYSAHQTLIEKAFIGMDAIEAGEICNPDENRMVGHFWLRDAKRAPCSELTSAIESTVSRVKEFACAVHKGNIVPPSGGKFKHALIVGVGGSSLGPQFMTRALRGFDDPIDTYYFDNTDPDGMDEVIASIPDLSKCLCVVISKSGGTKETRNGQLVAKQAWERAGLDSASAFVAVTGEGSALDKTASEEGWLARFPMWDWVGGRMSIWSAVGLLPAALQGFAVDVFLEGGAAMDSLTRDHDVKSNPAAQLALMWYFTAGGKGEKAMVILPYKDRLELLGRYLQQLVMESLGKEKDLDGNVVNQGLTVYGNKGSTDQHAYIQQLRDGRNDFFAVFVEVLKDTSGRLSKNALPPEFSAEKCEVESGVTSGDYLSGFYQGTRSALYEGGRASVSIVVREVSEHSLGMLIALFERAVGLYATLINVNAYHQPGVEAGKKAAGRVLEIQKSVIEFLDKSKGVYTAEELSSEIGKRGEVETVFKILSHLAANGRVKVEEGTTIFDDRYGRG